MRRQLMYLGKYFNHMFIPVQSILYSLNTLCLVRKGKSGLDGREAECVLPEARHDKFL